MYSAIIGRAESKVFYLDASGGTGKSFTMRAVQDLLRIRKRKVVTVVTSALAVALLEGGRTTNSVFKVPVPCDDGAQCAVTAESEHGVNSFKPM